MTSHLLPWVLSQLCSSSWGRHTQHPRKEKGSLSVTGCSGLSLQSPGFKDSATGQGASHQRRSLSHGTEEQGGNPIVGGVYTSRRPSASPQASPPSVTHCKPFSGLIQDPMPLIQDHTSVTQSPPQGPPVSADSLGGLSTDKPLQLQFHFKWEISVGKGVESQCLADVHVRQCWCYGQPWRISALGKNITVGRMRLYMQCHVQWYRSEFESCAERSPSQLWWFVFLFLIFKLWSNALA